MSDGNLIVVNNSASSRYEIAVDGKIAVLEYILSKDVITFTHTGTPDELRGRGLAGIITRHALDAARADGLKVNPQCSYVESFIKKNSEYADLVV